MPGQSPVASSGLAFRFFLTRYQRPRLTFRRKNVLAGALFSPSLATLLLTALTTVGSACATLLSTPLAPFLSHFFPRALELTRAAIEGDNDPADSKSTSQAWVRLSVLRLVGVVPWSGINIACGVCGVPLWDCILGTFIGTLPWTAVTCQVGTRSLIATRVRH